MSRTIAIPFYILDDEQLLKIATALMAVENELEPERGRNQQAHDCAETLLAELDARATDRYRLVDGKIRKV